MLFVAGNISEPSTTAVTGINIIFTSQGAVKGGGEGLVIVLQITYLLML